MDVSELRAKIRDIEDFPTEGILFKDITTLLKDPKAFRCVLDEMATGYLQSGVEIVVGVESRGFIFGGALAYALGCGFVPARKPGKLPWETVQATYELEYGSDTLEMHRDGVGDGGPADPEHDPPDLHGRPQPVPLGRPARLVLSSGDGASLSRSGGPGSASR